MRRAAKVDRNQSEIVAALRQAGATVEPLHTVGKGCPDLLVGFRGANYLLEVKDGQASPSRRQLNETQVDWHATWRGRVCKVDSIKQAYAAVGITAQTRGMSASEIVAEAARDVSAATGFAVSDIMSACRARDICAARWHVMRRARDAGLSYPAIGRAMGMDHTSVMHGLERLQEVANRG